MRLWAAVAVAGVMCVEHCEGSGAWFFGAYHKTGCVLILKLLGSLSPFGYVRLQGRFESPPRSLASRPFEHYWFSPDATALEVLPKSLDYRFAHFARDPAELIVSAYRYHLVAKAGERWLDMPSGQVDAPARDEFELEHVRSVPRYLRLSGDPTLAATVESELERGHTWRVVLPPTVDDPRWPTRRPP